MPRLDNTEKHLVHDIKKYANERRILDDAVLSFTLIYSRIFKRGGNLQLLSLASNLADLGAHILSFTLIYSRLKILSEAWKELMRDKKTWGKTEKSLQRLQKEVVAL